MMRDGSLYREERIKATTVLEQCMRRASGRPVQDLRENNIGGHSSDADRTCSVCGTVRS